MSLTSLGTEVNQRLRGGLLFFVIGAAILAGGAYVALPHVQDVNSAEPVDAEVLGTDTYSTSPAGESDREYYANVTYRYSYEGAEYTSDSLFPGNRDEQVSRSRAEEIAGTYAAGDSVTAQVVPDDPTRSYLIEADMPWWYYLAPGFGALLVLAGLLNVVQGIRGVGPQT